MTTDANSNNNYRKNKMKSNAIIFATLLLIGTTSTVSAKTDTAQLENIAKAIIVALNSDDFKLWEQLLKDHYLYADSASAIERWQGHFQMFSQELGKVDIQNIDVSDPTLLRILIRSKNPRSTSEWKNLEVYMHAEKKDKFFSLGIRPGSDPNIILPDRPLTIEEIANYVGNLIDGMVVREAFSGAVLLAKDDNPFFTGAFGKADLRWGIDNKLDTKFNLGSMNKMFTGVAICQLASQKKLSFDDPIIMHLPDFPNEEIANKVTVYHLLTHTSGMGSYWDAMDKMDWTGLRSVKDFADLAMGDSLEFEPGERFGYSNTGPLVLGLIIEAISSMDYHDYIRQYVTGPAGND